MALRESDEVRQAAGGILSQRINRRAFMARMAVVSAAVATAPACLGLANTSTGSQSEGEPPSGDCPSINPLLLPGQAITREDIAIAGEGVQIRAYSARPQGVDSAPGVLVIHENRGLVAYLRDVADGLATAGYHAVVPDLLSREGGTPLVPDVPAALREIPRDRHLGDLDATLAYLRTQPGVTTVGVMGFCFGGALTWQMATRDPDLAAAVPFYGASPPLEDVPNIRAAVFAVYGGLDTNVNGENNANVEAMRQALTEAGVTHQITVYPDSPHAFHNHTNAERYNAETARQAWRDALAWLDQHLKG